MNTTACYENYLCHCGEEFTDVPHTCYFTEQEDYNDDARLNDDERY